MQVIREIVTREALKNYVIPDEFGNQFEMILLPIKNNFSNNILRKKNKEIMDEVSENEQFLGAVYNSVIEDNDKEDAIWSKYL